MIFSGYLLVGRGVLGGYREGLILGIRDGIVKRGVWSFVLDWFFVLFLWLRLG